MRARCHAARRALLSAACSRAECARIFLPLFMERKEFFSWDVVLHNVTGRGSELTPNAQDSAQGFGGVQGSPTVCVCFLPGLRGLPALSRSPGICSAPVGSV